MALDKTDKAREIDNAENVPGLVAHVKKKFTSAEDGKHEDETRWLKAYKNYRGIFILNESDMGKAKILLATDPAIKAKFLDYDIFPWYGSAALSEYLEASDKVWKVGF